MTFGIFSPKQLRFSGLSTVSYIIIINTRNIKIDALLHPNAVTPR